MALCFMSFDLYLQGFHRGECVGIPRQRFRDALGDLVCDFDFAADGDPSRVQGVTLHRPCDDPRLWEALASLLAPGDTVLYFPGGAPLVGCSSAVEHLPTDMVEALGQPVVVTSGGAIRRRIERNP